MLTGVGVYLLENGRLTSDDTTGDKKDTTLRQAAKSSFRRGGASLVPPSLVVRCWWGHSFEGSHSSWEFK